MTRLLIFDISSFIFRAFFAIRPLSAPDGTPVNAVYGVLNMVINALEELHPTHVVMAMDSKGKSFRHEIYSDYKANRSAPPEDLIPQFALIQKLIDELEIPRIADEKLEADDIIGCLATQYRDHFDEVMIASSDKDLMQFVHGNVKMVDTMKAKLYGEKEVIEKMGVKPSQIVDYLSLVGDTSDNIPGVKGIGAKGAAKLLDQYGSLENIFENISEITNKRVLNGLTNHKDDAFLSKSLVKIVCDHPLDYTPEQLKYELEPSDSLKDFLMELNFKSAVKKIYSANNDEVKSSKVKSSKETKSEKLGEVVFENEISETPNVTFIKYQVLEFIKKIKKGDQLALIFEDKYLAVSNKDINFVYFFKEDVYEILSEILLKDIEILSYEPKKLIRFSIEQSLDTKASLYDVRMAYFNIDASTKNTEKSLLNKFFQYEVPKIKKNEQMPDEVYVQRVKALFKLGNQFKELLTPEKGLAIFEKIDLNLNAVLAEIESNGIGLDKKVLNELEVEYSNKLKEIEKSIFDLSETEVNLKSPKQVSELLFEKLELPVIKKTKTGYSTDSSVLTKLAEMDLSDVPAKILEYREIDKLLSTYVKVLPTLVNEKTNRVHTSFEQNVAATGRLSSVNPNLQNIPIKSELGRRIRKGFIASEGKSLVAADYSQVELRVLAHFCQDEVMLNAFKNNEDIHTQTASEVFGIPVEDVTKEIRSNAKAINFGLIYGQSSFGLSETLGISRTEAKEYITFYFERFSKVKSFLDSLKESCEKTGYAETLLGRKRLVPEINSKNRTIKSFGDRIAINSPIQGTAADIIKIAMLNISKKMPELFSESKMILQVHDELIFETPDEKAEDLKRFVVKEMEGAYKLSVPLKVDASIGKDWYALK